MKLTNTKYMLIENEAGIHEVDHKEIDWKAVAILVGVVLFIAVHLVGWYL